MGDLIGEVVESELYFIAKAEFDRVARLNAPRTAISALYADMARLNALCFNRANSAWSAFRTPNCWHCWNSPRRRLR